MRPVESCEIRTWIRGSSRERTAYDLVCYGLQDYCQLVCSWNARGHVPSLRVGVDGKQRRARWRASFRLDLGWMEGKVCEDLVGTTTRGESSDEVLPCRSWSRGGRSELAPLGPAIHYGWLLHLAPSRVKVRVYPVISQVSRLPLERTAELVARMSVHHAFGHLELGPGLTSGSRAAG